jgi:hypothetical protein
MIANEILSCSAADRYVDRLARFRSTIPVVSGVAFVFTLAMMGMTLTENILASVIVQLSIVRPHGSRCWSYISGLLFRA